MEAMASDRKEKRQRPETTKEKVIMSADVRGHKYRETKLNCRNLQRNRRRLSESRADGKIGQGGSVSEGLAPKA